MSKEKKEGPFYGYGVAFDTEEEAIKHERRCRIGRWIKCLEGGPVKMDTAQIVELAAYLADEHEFVYEY